MRRFVQRPHSSGGLSPNWSIWKGIQRISDVRSIVVNMWYDDVVIVSLMLVDILLCHMLGDKICPYIVSLLILWVLPLSGILLCPIVWNVELVFPVVGSVAAAVQTARYCGSGLNMMLLLFIRCLWEYGNPSGLIFTLALVHCRVGVSGYCGDLSRTTRRRSVLGAMFWMRKDMLLHDR